MSQNRLYYLQTRKSMGTVFISYLQNNSYHGVTSDAENAEKGLERAISIIKELKLKSSFDKEIEMYKNTYLKD